MNQTDKQQWWSLVEMARGLSYDQWTITEEEAKRIQSVIEAHLAPLEAIFVEGERPNGLG